MNFFKPTIAAASLAAGLVALTGATSEASAAECLICEHIGEGGSDFPWDPHDVPDNTGDEPGDGIDDDDDPPDYLPAFRYGSSSDILWHHGPSGVVAAWRQSASNTISDSTLDWEMPSSSGWQIVGTGNFDRSKDTNRDILWYHPATGVLSVWKMSGKSEPKGYENLSWNVPGNSGWKVVGVADYNGDGHSDIYWHHPESGVIGVWIMKDAQPQSTLNLDYHEYDAFGHGRVATVGDFNGDGHPDLVIHYPGNGYVSFVYQNGTAVMGISDASRQATASTGWVLEGKGDFNHDGKLDLLWHHAGTGAVAAWLMNGATVTGDIYLPWNVQGSSGWKIVSR